MKFAAAAMPLLLAAPALAQQTPTLQQETTLILRGEAEVSVKPDFATINIGVTKEAPTATEAMKQQATAMTSALAALKLAGVPDKDIRTSNVSLNPAYTYIDNQPPKLRGYTATNRVTVTLRDLSKMGGTLDAAVGGGSNSINGVVLGVDKDEVPRREARAGAIRDAMSKAEDYASAMGYRVKRIVRVAEPGAGQEYYGGGAIGGVIAFGQASSPIEAGDVTLRQAVDVTFELTK